MSSASLADKYITRTGERPAPVAQEIAAPSPIKWSGDEMAEFKALAPAGLYIAVSDVAVSGAEHDRDGTITRIWGGTKGIRLARIGITKAPPWQDKLSVVFSRSPVGIAVAGRLWTTDFNAVAALEQQAEMVLAADACAPEVNGYTALPHDCDVPRMIARLQMIARAHGVQVVETDAELHDTCRRMVERK